MLPLTSSCRQRSLVLSSLALWLIVAATLPALGLPAQVTTRPQPPKLRLEETGHWRMIGGTAFSLAFDPTGRMLASGGKNGEVLLWDWEKRQVLHRFPKEGSWIGTLRFSPDGKQLALMGRGLRIIDPRTGTDLFSRAAGGPHGLAYDSTGKRLAYASGNGIVNVLNTQTWKILRCFQAEERLPVRSLCFGPKDKLVFAGTNKGHVWRLDLESGNETLVNQLGSTAQGLAILPAGQLLCVSWNGLLWVDKEIRARHYESLEPAVKGKRRVPKTVYEMAVDPTHGRIAMGGAAALVSLWNPEGQSLGTLPIGKSPVSAMAFAPSGEILVATYDGRILIFDKGKLVQTLWGHDADIKSLAFSGDGKHIAISGGQSQMIDLRSGLSQPMSRSGGFFTGRLAHEIGMLQENEVQILDSRTQKVAFRYPVKHLNQSSTRIASLSPDGKRLAIGGYFSSVPMILDLETGKTQVLTGYWSTSLGLAWESDGRHFLHTRVSGNHGEFGSIDRVSIDGSHTTIHKRSSAFQAVALSPDGQWILTTSGGGSINNPQAQILLRIDARKGRVEREVPSQIHWLRYLDDNLFLAHDGQQLSLWDAHKLEQIQTFPQGGITMARLSRDKKHLALTQAATLRVFRILR